MSIEANTCEEMTLKNVNEKTAAFAKAVGEYLQTVWGVIRLSVDVDGVHYETDADPDKDSELYAVCGRLETAKNLHFFMRSGNSGGLYWRQESSFLSLLSEDEDLKANLIYHSTDYYDCDTNVDLFLFDKNGSQSPGDTNGPAISEKVRKWYSNTTDVFVNIENAAENVTLHDAFFGVFSELADRLFADADEEERSDFIVDEWENHEGMWLDGSFSFTTEDVPRIAELLQKLADLTHAEKDAELTVNFTGVPDGEEDYDFAAVQFEAENGKVRINYSEF